jgi:hypothetical protein
VLIAVMRYGVNSRGANITMGSSGIAIGQYSNNDRVHYTFGHATKVNQTGRPYYGMTLQSPITHMDRPGGAQALRLGQVLRAEVTPETESYHFPDAAVPQEFISMIDANSMVLTAEQDLVVEPGQRIALDQSLITWRNGAYFVQFQVGSVDANNYRACWHVLLPNVVRLACFIHGRENDWTMGFRSSDDSDGQGKRDYELLVIN